MHAHLLLKMAKELKRLFQIHNSKSLIRTNKHYSLSQNNCHTAVTKKMPKDRIDMKLALYNVTLSSCLSWLLDRLEQNVYKYVIDFFRRIAHLHCLRCPAPDPLWQAKRGIPSAESTRLETTRGGETTALLSSPHITFAFIICSRAPVITTRISSSSSSSGISIARSRRRLSSLCEY